MYLGVDNMRKKQREKLTKIVAISMLVVFIVVTFVSMV